MKTSTVRRQLIAALLVLLTAPAFGLGTEDHGASADVAVGTLTLSEAFSRATRPGAPVAGGFMTIVNGGSDDDRLVGAASEVAASMQIHETADVDGVMKMRELAGGLPIPAGETVALKPGGYHIMFMELKQPLVEGETVEVTLTFAKAGSVTVPLAILEPDATSFEPSDGQ